MSKGSEQAFPTLGEELRNGEYRWGEFGLSKREIFAAMAMQGMLSSETELGVWIADKCAPRAVRFADALLDELSK